MKKYGRHYLRRCLSVFLAVAMVCAAAQMLVFAVSLSAEDITPGWGQGSARARYTTSGTLEITFPESTKSDAIYYAEVYDLDRVDRESPVIQAFQLTTTRTYVDDATQINATLDRSWVEDKLNMSHRISIAITAVSGGWRSETIEALVGGSLDVPQAGSPPNGTDLYASLARFEETSPDDVLENGGASYKGAPYWSYDKGANGIGAMDINGVFADDMDSPYEYPGFNGSSAFRLYLNGSDQSMGEDERFDVMYRQDHWKFENAEDLWIWVDTSFVEFDEFAIQVHYMDYTGTAYWDVTDKYHSVSLKTKYSEDAYSTIGYAKAHGGESVPVYYLNDDGLWDVIYTNENGYLEDFGHYRGFLRVPVDKLWNENDSVKYNTLRVERPHSYNVNIQSDWPFHTRNELLGTAEELFESDNLSYTWQGWVGNPNLSWEDDEVIYNFDKDKFNQQMRDNEQVGLSVIPIEDIASVGITWNGASADSLNKPFYIDQVGFSGQSLETNHVDNDPNPVMTLDQYAMVPNNAEAVNQLIEKYIPNPELVSVADSGIVEDLETICNRLKLAYPDKLTTARARLNNILSGATDSVAYVSRQLKNTDSLSSDDIIDLYTIYRSFTLGEIHRLGVEDEYKLLDLYEQKGSDEWFPDKVLNDIYYLPFNDVESGYSVGQSALHEYDDYNLTPEGQVHYFDHGHILNWKNSDVDMTQAWENTKNLLAYSRMGYNDERNGTMQRFGYGITTIGQSGFANSKSVNTMLYRDTLSSGTDVENYRISLTYNGDSKESWNNLEKGNFSGADYFTFYADFSNVKDIRKLWITIRTGDGTIYSNDETNSAWSYNAFSLDNPNKGWYPLSSDDDGCLGAGLVGFRGFIRIPVSYFNEIGGDRILTDALSTVGQVKVFLSGNPGGNDEAGNSFILDMFGFISNDPDGNFTQTLKEQYHQLVGLPDPVHNAMEQFNEALAGLFTTVKDINNADLKLFNYSAETVSTYSQLIKAYNMLTLGDKQTADDAVQAASGGKYTGVDELQLFVKNYDAWGGVIGNLQKNAATENNLRTTVEAVFGQNTGLADGTPNQIDSIFAVCDCYPDYYQYSVQTYWPNRNLHAVFPNYNPQNVVSLEAAMKLNGDQYTGTFDLSYVGAVSGVNGMNFQLSSSTVTLYSEDNASITVDAALQSGATVVNGRDQTRQVLFTIPESNVTHAGTYTGRITLSVDVLPDEGSQLGAAASRYRQSFEITVTLQCEPSYTVVIPADISLDWKSESHDTSVAIQEGYYLPAGASVHVTADAGERSLVASGEFAGAEIPYILSGEGTDWEFTSGDALRADVEMSVDSEVWDRIPLTRYEDKITFNVEYTDSAAGN